jgi:hypothetical protein
MIYAAHRRQQNPRRRKRSVGEINMTKRDPGYYWVTWSGWIDEETAARRPGPQIGLWDGEVWWLVRQDRSHYDVDMKVIGELIRPPAVIVARPVAVAS